MTPWLIAFTMKVDWNWNEQQVTSIKVCVRLHHRCLFLNSNSSASGREGEDFSHRIIIFHPPSLYLSLSVTLYVPASLSPPPSLDLPSMPLGLHVFVHILQWSLKLIILVRALSVNLQSKAKQSNKLCESYKFKLFRPLNM